MLGCIADEYTGTTDVAALRSAGLRTVLFFGPSRPDATLPACDAFVVAITKAVPLAPSPDETIDDLRWLAQSCGVPVDLEECS